MAKLTANFTWLKLNTEKSQESRGKVPELSSQKVPRELTMTELTG